MLNKYRFGFEPWAAVLFVLIMLPNIIWFALPENPQDVLRAQDTLPAADTASSIARVLMTACLCFLKNTQARPPLLRPLTIACALCVLAYYVMWALYFRGLNTYGFFRAPVVWGLCVFPCAAFILFSIDRRNFPALAFALIFTVCHALCTGTALTWNALVLSFVPN